MRCSRMHPELGCSTRTRWSRSAGTHGRPASFELVVKTGIWSSMRLVGLYRRPAAGSRRVVARAACNHALGFARSSFDLRQTAVTERESPTVASCLPRSHRWYRRSPDGRAELRGLDEAQADPTLYPVRTPAAVLQRRPREQRRHTSCNPSPPEANRFMSVGFKPPGVSSPTAEGTAISRSFGRMA